MFQVGRAEIFSHFTGKTHHFTYPEIKSPIFVENFGKRLISRGGEVFPCPTKENPACCEELSAL